MEGSEDFTCIALSDLSDYFVCLSKLLCQPLHAAEDALPVLVFLQPRCHFRRVWFVPPPPLVH